MNFSNERRILHKWEINHFKTEIFETFTKLDCSLSEIIKLRPLRIRNIALHFSVYKIF